MALIGAGLCLAVECYRLYKMILMNFGTNIADILEKDIGYFYCELNLKRVKWGRDEDFL